MQIYEYILQNYDKGDPIFLSELVEVFGDNTRQYVKKLIDTGKLERFETGTYFIPYTNIFGIKGTVSIEKYIRRKYLENKNMTIGYMTGIGNANKNGFTTQNAAIYELRSNIATTTQRRIIAGKFNILVYKPYVSITNENANTLQFLDLLTNLESFSELSGDDLKKKLKEYIIKKDINMSLVRQYIDVYPVKVFKNAYYGGIMDELV